MELSCSCSGHCRGGHASGKPNVSWCWHLAACAVIHQLLTAPLQRDANVAETNCAKQQLSSSLLPGNFRCRKATSMSQTADSALFTKTACAKLQKTESRPAFIILHQEEKALEEAYNNHIIIILIMKWQSKSSIQVPSIKPLTLSNGSWELWVSRTEFWLPGL